MANELRVDALHNRNRILEAARHAFATRGIDVPMAAIARRAGVGVATLYRRFPTRESLITEVFAEQQSKCVAVHEKALADPDPWRGFRTFVEKLCAMQVTDRGFTAAFLVTFPETIGYESECERAERGFATLIQRAKAAGQLRADFDQADFVLLLIANNGIIAAAGDAAPAASRRFVAHMLQSFRTHQLAPNRPLPPPPVLDLRQVYPYRRES